MNRNSILLNVATQEVNEDKRGPRSPWMFVPTLYFAAGLPYVIVNSVAVVLYKKLGIDNGQIAFWTSLLYLPWVLKMVWGPLIDLYSTKRNWILYTELAMLGCLSCLALCLQLPNYYFISLFVLMVVAFISATQDTAIDGFYLLTLDKEVQAFFVGIRSSFYRIAMIFGSGFLVFLAGQLEIFFKKVSLSWTIAISVSAFTFFLLLVFHWFSLPFPESDDKRQIEISFQTFYTEVIKTYFNQEKIWAILAFILLYRIGEAMIVKLASPFLLDAVESGGLGLTTSQVGLAYGTFGSLSLTVGGVLGGWLVFYYGLKSSMLPMALALNLPHLFYIYMAYARPAIQWTYALVAVEQFGYGLGTAAYSVYFMYLTKEKYKTSHFAISTGMMALGMMLPGLISGYIQQAVGYQMFFVIVFLLTIPGMLTLLFIPLDNKQFFDNT